MYIKKYFDDVTYVVEMNPAEFQVFKKMFGKLIFNPEGVSNAFQINQEEVEIVRKMNGYLYGTGQVIK